MSMPRLESYLRENGVAFATSSHDRAFTAQEVAAQAHISGRDVAKSVMVMLDDELVMVVLPATERLNLGRLRQTTGAREARLASEWEFMHRFPECETGAMPRYPRAPARCKVTLGRAPPGDTARDPYDAVVGAHGAAGPARTTARRLRQRWRIRHVHATSGILSARERRRVRHVQP